MDVASGALGGVEDIKVGPAGVARMDAALHADLGCAAIPCLAPAARDLIEVKVVSRAAQGIAELAFGKCAELAAITADVGVIDVAIDDVGNCVAIDARAQRIGCGAYGVVFGASRLEQRD